jgi:hypothetical protein
MELKMRKLAILCGIMIFFVAGMIFSAFLNHSQPRQAKWKTITKKVASYDNQSLDWKSSINNEKASANMNSQQLLKILNNMRLQ